VNAFLIDRREAGRPARTAARAEGTWQVIGDHPAADTVRAALEEPSAAPAF